MFNMDPSKPFLDCYIFEVKQWPKYGPNLEHHAIADIYHYNSLNDSFENKKQSPYIQIPEYFVENVDIQKLINMKNQIINDNIPIMKMIAEEKWIIDYGY